MARFSVVIPLYNKENYISKTLKSVLDQSFSDFEIIVVDDCSTDASLEVARKFDDQRIQIIRHEKNKGLSASRNTGIRHAHTDYIAFLDADDLWKKGFLEKIDFLIAHYPKASLFATKYEVRLKNDRLVKQHFSFENFKIHGLIDNFFEGNLNQSIYYPSCLCVKKTVFEDVGYYNEQINYSEDVDFNIRAHAKYKMAYWNEALVTYLQVSENQITQNSLIGKTIPDYNHYENEFKGRKDIKKYLDFQRYIKAKLYKLSNDKQTYLRLINNIEFSNLNLRQKLLLRSPKIILQAVALFKAMLQKIGIEVHSYSS